MTTTKEARVPAQPSNTCRVHGPTSDYGPEDNDPGTMFITHNVDDTVTIKVRSPGDRVFSEVEMSLDTWHKLRGVGGPTNARPPVDITGWKLVPDQPTEEMWQAGRSADIHPGDSYSKVWAAMFHAAPCVDDCETTVRNSPQESYMRSPGATEPGPCVRLQHGIACDDLAKVVSERDHARRQVERLKESLRESVSDNVWSAYHSGIVRDGRWMDGGLSDAEWLQRMLDLEPGWHDATMIRSRLPEVVEKHINDICSVPSTLCGEDK